MRRWLILISVAFGVFGAVLLGLLYTPPGHSIIASLIGDLSGGKVRIAGLRGNLPGAMHADSLEIADADGVWLRAEDLSLDWSAFQVLQNRYHITRITAGRVIVLRRPRQETSTGENPQIDIDAASLPRIEIAKSVIGRAALLGAEGALHYTSLKKLSADLTVSRLDSNDRYRVNGGIDDGVATGTLAIFEEPKGILGALLGFPGFAPINASATAGGSRSANTVSFRISAGALHASGKGTFSLTERRANLDFLATAPAMQPNADIAWQSLVLDGRMRGPLDAPQVSGRLRVQDAKFSGAEIGMLAADVSGDKGSVDVDGTATSLRLPGEHPALFASAPVTVKAHADLTKPSRPVAFQLTHPLATISGNADTAGAQRVSADVTIPQLAPFAALAGENVRGDARLKFTLAQSAGAIAVTGDGKLRMDGASLVTRLLGGNSTIGFAAKIHGTDVTDSRLAIESAGLRTEAKGEFVGRRLNYAAQLRFPDLSRFAKTLNGSLALSVNVNGPFETASISASGDADMASRGFARQHIAIGFQATGLPRPASARFQANGNLDGSKIALTGNLTADGKGQTAKLNADWKSLHATGDIAFPQTGSPSGASSFEVKQLADLATFVGTNIAGSVTAVANLKAQGKTSVLGLNVRGSKIATSGVKLNDVTANGSIGDPFGKPGFALALAADGIETEGVSGRGTARLDGPENNLAATLTSELSDADGNPIHVQANAVLDLVKKKAALQTFKAGWRAQTIALEAPAHFDFAQGLAVDRFAAHVGGGEIAVSGRIAPKLALSVRVKNIDLKTLHTVVPDVPVAGTLSADADLGGTPEAPTGTFDVQGRGLRALDYSDRVVAPANLDAHGTLNGHVAALDATLSAGKSAHLELSGDAPLRAGEHMKLHLTGTADIATFNPILLASGRQARGTLAVDMNFAGTWEAPFASGGAKITGGEVQDFARGVRIQGIEATVTADGRKLKIASVSARAGPGTITGSGTIDLGAPGFPLDLALEAHDARPIENDLMTATLSGNVKLAGRLDEAATLSGKITVTRGEINLPDRFPPQVAILNVRHRGQKPPAHLVSRVVALDLTVAAPGQIFVRGRGVDAVVGGSIHITGTSDYPLVGGGFTMDRGTFSLAGQTLDFTTGKVSFDGAGVRNTLDPTLNFVAQTSSGGTTATLTLGGYVSAPKIALSSSPQLPQDEILAHLLFQQSVKQLTPLQLAQLAQIIAELGGGSSGFNPLGAIRKQLGLDRLSVGSTTGGSSGTESQATVEAGKYVSRNIYVGAKQNLSGGTQVQVQVDITKRLKAQATLSTTTNATVTKGNTAQDNGSSVGLSYQFEY